MKIGLTSERNGKCIWAEGGNDIIILKGRRTEIQNESPPLN